jgi:hypothetical protein
VGEEAMAPSHYIHDEHNVGYLVTLQVVNTWQGDTLQSHRSGLFLCAANHKYGEILSIYEDILLLHNFLEYFF